MCNQFQFLIRSQCGKKHIFQFCVRSRYEFRTFLRQETEKKLQVNPKGEKRSLGSDRSHCKSWESPGKTIRILFSEFFSR